MVFEQLCRRFVRVRFHNHVEIQIVPDVGDLLGGDALGLAQWLSLIDDILLMILHPLVPGLHHVVRHGLGFCGIGGFLPVFDHAGGNGEQRKELLHGAAPS